MYKKIGEINGFSEIPWGKEIIITGSVGKVWYWQVKGNFIKNENSCRFKDECGVFTQFAPDDFISLNVLEEVSDARKPEGEKKS